MFTPIRCKICGANAAKLNDSQNEARQMRSTIRGSAFRRRKRAERAQRGGATCNWRNTEIVGVGAAGIVAAGLRCCRRIGALHCRTLCQQCPTYRHIVEGVWGNPYLHLCTHLCLCNVSDMMANASARAFALFGRAMLRQIDAIRFVCVLCVVCWQCVDLWRCTQDRDNALARAQQMMCARLCMRHIRRRRV